LFAARLLRDPAKDASALVDRAYQLALGRSPSESEKRTAVEFLTSQADLIRQRLQARLTVALPIDMPDGVDPALAAALADFCLAMMNRNEFLYVP
jgi:hypothetical protein